MLATPACSSSCRLPHLTKFPLALGNAKHPRRRFMKATAKGTAMKAAGGFINGYQSYRS
jgi:hypothetical protein